MKHKENILWTFIIIVGFLILFIRSLDRSIDKEIKPIIKDFKALCEISEVDCGKVDKISYIYFKDIKDYGSYVSHTRNDSVVISYIEISETLRDDPIVLKVVVFHELFHSLGLGHKKEYLSIMKDTLNNIDTYREVYKDKLLLNLEVLNLLNEVK